MGVENNVRLSTMGAKQFSMVAVYGIPKWTKW